MGRETFMEGLEWSRGPGGVRSSTRRARRSQKALLEGREGLGGPLRGPGGIGRPYGRAGRGWEGWEESGGPPG